MEHDLYACFRKTALGARDATAAVGYDGTPSSYGTLLSAIDRAADRLRAELGPRDVLGLAADDPLTFIALYLAAAKLDVVTVLLDGRLPAEELQRYAAKYDVGWLAVDAPGDHGFALRAADDLIARRARAREGYASDDFAIVCTSGSTGEPKGIVMSQAAIMARVRVWSGEMDLAPEDVVLCALPLAHCHGIEVLTLPTLLRGATVIFARGHHLTGRGLARQIDAHGVTVVSGLPIMYQMLVGARGVSRTALRTLRLAISGSAPLPTSTQEEFRERCGLPLRQVYGLSEIGVICFDKRYVGRGSIGTPIAGIEWRLNPAEIGEPDSGVEHGDLRELYVRGHTLARGYYRDPAADAEMFEDGWLRTRDLVVAEEDGWYVRGRQSSFINVAGSKVGPLEIEAALRDCAGVRDSAVVGVPDGDSNERVAALIVADNEFDLSAVRRHLSERLLSYQVPQRYELASSLPRTSLGKVDYAAVRRLMTTDEVSVS